MPLSPFACSECGLEFDVSREADDLDRPGDCPLDGAVALRCSDQAPLQRHDGTEVRWRQRVSWAAFTHDHGAETLPHLHGRGTPFHSS